jgi:hypothetical protein
MHICNAAHRIPSNYLGRVCGVASLSVTATETLAADDVLQQLGYCARHFISPL